MDQRRIGELSVSVVGLGCNQLGTAACDAATGEQVVHEALEAGITYFDTSDEYGRDYANPSSDAGWGRSEEVLGQALRHRRDDVVIATKFGPFGPLGDPNTPDYINDERSHASTRGIAIAVEESLRRLQTDRIDLYQLHFFDPRFEVSETLGALDELVRAGKVREIGTSNFTGPQLRTAHDVAVSRGLRPFASNQGQLNIIRRAELDDSVPVCDELGLGFIPYYPLASGVLTGKYRRGTQPATGTRLADQVDDSTRSRMLSDRLFTRIEALEAYATERGHTLLELAFAWLLGLPAVPSVIAGSARPGQASANAKAASWNLTPAEVAEVTAIAASAG
jgi:aryl-alcohol dehydrogenase-like predicted oxidoreductase